MDIKKIKALKKILVKDGNMLRIYRFFKFVPDKAYLKFMFRFRMGYKLNLKNPETFNEKLQYLKLYDRNPLYTTMADKLRVNEYVRQKCGSEIKFIKVVGKWNRFDDIDFDKLPERFVLKCNHNSGNVIICTDKALFDKKTAKKKLDFAVKHNFYWAMREWPYKNIEPKIIAEEYVYDRNGQLPDYKIFTFNGKPQFIYVRSGNRQYVDFYDIHKNHLDILDDFPIAPEVPALPETIDKMTELAEKLAEGTKHLRVDFYDINGEIYFGELTFYHDGGFAPLKPVDWDLKLGNLIKL